MASLRQLPSGTWNLLWLKNKRQYSFSFNTKEEAIRFDEEVLKTTGPLVYNEKARHRIYMTVRKRARKSGVIFSISEEDIILPKYCPLLGIELDYNGGNGRHCGNPSLDKVDNTLGYISGNIRVISHKANTMKNDATKEQILFFAEQIKKYLVGK